MRIVFDGRTIDKQITGVGMYSLYLLKHLLQLDSSNEYFCLCNETQIIEKHLSSFKNFNVIKVNVSYNSHPYGEIWENYGLQKMLAKLKCDIFHGPAYLIPWRKSSSYIYKKIITIHDLAFMKFPEYFPFRFQYYLKWLTNHTIDSADVILTDSESTRSDLIAMFKIKNKDKVKVVYCGVDDTFYQISDKGAIGKSHSLNLPDRYILSVGTIEPRKNHIKLIELFERLKIEYNIPHKLLLVGKVGWKSDKIIKRIETSLFKSDIIHKGYVSNEELNSIYNYAEIFVYLSKYEGFGLPVVEAMKCGIPIIAADNSSIPEVLGDCGILADTSKFDDIKTQILTIINKPTYAAELSQRALKRASLFSWKKSAEEVLSIYSTL